MIFQIWTHCASRHLAIGPFSGEDNFGQMRDFIFLECWASRVNPIRQMFSISSPIVLNKLMTGFELTLYRRIVIVSILAYLACKRRLRWLARCLSSSSAAWLCAMQGWFDGTAAPDGCFEELLSVVKCIVSGNREPRGARFH